MASKSKKNHDGRDAAIAGGLFVAGLIIGCYLCGGKCSCGGGGTTGPKTITLNSWSTTIHLNQELAVQGTNILWGGTFADQLVTGTSTGFSEFANFNLQVGAPFNVSFASAGPAIAWYDLLGLQAKIPQGTTATVTTTLQAKDSTGTIVSNMVTVTVVIGA